MQEHIWTNGFVTAARTDGFPGSVASANHGSEARWRPCRMVPFVAALSAALWAIIAAVLGLLV